MNIKSPVIKGITLLSFFGFVIAFVLFRMGYFSPQNQDVLAFNPNGTVLNSVNYTPLDSAKLAKKNEKVVKKSRRTMDTHFVIVRDAKTNEVIDSVYKNPMRAASSKVLILSTDDLVNFENAVTGKYIFEYLPYNKEEQGLKPDRPKRKKKDTARKKVKVDEFFIDEMSTSKSGRIFYEDDVKIDTAELIRMSTSKSGKIFDAKDVKFDSTKFLKMMKNDSVFQKTLKLQDKK